jgi:microcystin-dependent protein
MFGGNFAPAGWAFCQGQTLPISENDVLFTLIGTTYGGDGQETFNLPDLQGRLPVHAGTAKSGTTYQLGEKGGVESVTLTTNQIPIHNHSWLVSNGVSAQTNPTNNVVSQSSQAQIYIDDVPNVNMATNTIAPEGGSQPHDNFQPYLCISFIISLFGVFPTQN